MVAVLFCLTHQRCFFRDSNLSILTFRLVLNKHAEKNSTMLFSLFYSQCVQCTHVRLMYTSQFTYTKASKNIQNAKRVGKERKKYT